MGHTDLWRTVQLVQQIVEAHVGATASTIGVQDGPDAGQTVPHTCMCTFCHAPRNDFEAFGLFVDFQKLGDGVDRDASICRADGAIACWSVLKSLGLLGGWGLRGREEASYDDVGSSRG